MKNNNYYSTGKRKTASARIFAKKGNGIIYINKLILEKYFYKKNIKKIICKPLDLLNIDNKFNFYITVKGGGVSSQISAIIHGITRILIKFNNKFKKILKKNGLVTRDSRKVERKKIGFKKSRRRPQFSKR